MIERYQATTFDGMEDNMTNTTAHTPGPWLVYKDGARFPGIEAGSNGRNFSVVVYGNDNEIEGVKGRTHAEALANARLIAASPEMLAALEGCADALREAGKSFALNNPLAARPNLFELHEQVARKAIAKAKGQS